MNKYIIVPLGLCSFAYVYTCYKIGNDIREARIYCNKLFIKDIN